MTNVAIPIMFVSGPLNWFYFGKKNVYILDIVNIKVQVRNTPTHQF